LQNASPVGWLETPGLANLRHLPLKAQHKFPKDRARA
jgi:hypothetical protein